MIVFGLGCLLSLLWGNFLKFWIYKHLSKIKLWERPINILILVDVVIHHICYSVLLIIIGTWIATDTVAGNFIEKLFGIPVSDEGFCRVYFSMGLFSFHYDAIGSFGVCIYR